MKSNNELVKYGNQMNAVPFRNFNKRDLNIFFAIVSRMRNKGKRPITFTFKQLKRLSGINYGHHTARLYSDLKDTYSKLQHLSIYYENKDEFVSWILFPVFKISKKYQTCTVRVNNSLVGVLNDLAEQFTRFNLAEFSQLNSSYAKNMFRLIKQYRTTGILKLPMKKFRMLLCVPKSYSSTTINNRIIKPSLIELAPFIPNIHVEKYRNGRGGKITGYDLKFSKERHKQDDLHKNDVGIGWMMRNINNNKYFTNSMKRKARKKLLNKPFFTNSEKIPMAKFNRDLNRHRYDTHYLKLKLEQRNNHLLHLTEYQSRKIRKCIRHNEKHNKKQS